MNWCLPNRRRKRNLQSNVAKTLNISKPIFKLQQIYIKKNFFPYLFVTLQHEPEKQNTLQLASTRKKMKLSLFLTLRT